MGNLIYEDLTFKVRGSLFNVYNTHGPGFREETYKQSVLVDFEQEGVPFEREKTYPIIYRGKEVDAYRVDILVYGKIILELKSVAELHREQFPKVGKIFSCLLAAGRSCSIFQF